MTERQRAKLYVNDMLSYARLAHTFVVGVSRDEFDANPEKQLAVVRALEVIGEAAKGVPNEVRALAPGVPWKQIAGMRDKLIHHYFGVKLDTVWEVATRDLAALEPELEVLAKLL